MAYSTERELSDKFKRRWNASALWLLYWPVLIVFFPLYTVLAETPLATVLILGFGLFFFVLVGAAIWMLVGYYFDAKALKKADSDWVPTWWVWVLAHLILSPAFIAPIYLYKRTKYCGRPDLPLLDD